MTEQHQARDLLATLRDALQQLEFHLGCTRDGVDAIGPSGGAISAQWEGAVGF